jgi:hypothetical protein
MVLFALVICLFMSSEVGLENFIEHLWPNGYLYEWWIVAAVIVIFAAGTIWAFRPLWTEKRRRNDPVSRVSTCAIIAVLSSAMVMMPVYATPSADASVIDYSFQYELYGYLPEGLPLNGVGSPSALLYGPTDEHNLTVVCAVVVVVTVTVVAGVAYVTYKIIKACDGISKKKKKQLEDNDPDGGTNTSSTVSASFVIGYVPPTTADNANCDCAQPPFNFNFGGASAVATNLSAYVPDQEKAADLDSYLTRKGLSTNRVGSSFSIGNQTVDSLAGLPVQVAYHNGVIVVSIDGKTNTATTTIEYSSDLTSWRTLGAISVPVGTRINVGDSVTDRSGPQGFWRVR